MSFSKDPQKNYGTAPKGVTPAKPFCKRKAGKTTNSVADKTIEALNSMSKNLFSLAFPLWATNLDTGKFSEDGAPLTPLFEQGCELEINGVVDQFG